MNNFFENNVINTITKILFNVYCTSTITIITTTITTTLQYKHTYLTPYTLGRYYSTVSETAILRCITFPFLARNLLIKTLVYYYGYLLMYNYMEYLFSERD